MSEKADYISIGQHIAHAIGEDTWSNAILECEGKDFHRTIAPDVSPRMLLKQLHFNMLGYELLERALVMIRGTVSKPILISENGAHCMVTVVNTDKPELLKGKPFYMVDALAYFNRFIVIDGLESMEEGAGLKLLKRILDLAGDIPVFIQAGYLYYGEYEMIDSDSDCYSLPERLADYYKNVGFKDVNEHIGGYEDSIIMLHCTDYDYAMFMDMLYKRTAKIENIADYRERK